MIIAACESCNTVSLVREQPGYAYRIGQLVGQCSIVHVKPGNTEHTECEGVLLVISITA